MALIKCTECGREISDKAASCPSCGMPLNEIMKSKKKCAECGTEYEKEFKVCPNCGCPDMSSVKKEQMMFSPDFEIPKTEKKKNKLWILVVIIAIILIGGLITAHFFWPREEKTLSGTYTISREIGDITLTFNENGTITGEQDVSNAIDFSDSKLFEELKKQGGTFANLIGGFIDKISDGSLNGKVIGNWMYIEDEKVFMVNASLNYKILGQDYSIAIFENEKATCDRDGKIKIGENVYERNVSEEVADTTTF